MFAAKSMACNSKWRFPQEKKVSVYIKCATLQAAKDLSRLVAQRAVTGVSDKPARHVRREARRQEVRHPSIYVIWKSALSTGGTPYYLVTVYKGGRAEESVKFAVPRFLNGRPYTSTEFAELRDDRHQAAKKYWNAHDDCSSLAGEARFPMV